MITFDELPVFQVGIASIDIGKVDAYLQRLGVSTLDLEDRDATRNDLLNLSILSPIDPNYPTLAGYLSFGRHPQKVYRRLLGRICGMALAATHPAPARRVMFHVSK
ncbi:MAG: HATPase c 4 protein [Pseudomonadota bacterium]|nr:HATPase c 4 protein [Pseudomonadota bacterium]